MSEPRRIVDDGSASPELARLLRAARPPRPLDAVTFERSRRRLMALGAVPAALGVLVWVKHAALGAVLGIAVAAAATAPRWLAPRESSVAAPASAMPSSTLVPREEPVSVAPPPTPPPSAVSEPRRTVEVPSAPAASSDGGLSRELALLESARSELERRPGSCLALLARHEREFPGAALAVEREFLRVSALLRLGRRSEAEARANALRARSPGSLYERRLDALLGDAEAP
jgi:hypothetical protein